MGNPQKAIVSVINDLVTDQRVERSCNLLHEMGFHVTLVGRKLKNSPGLPERPYQLKRMRLISERGPLFYMEYNIRLFFFLLFHKADFLLSNDLDTLLPNYIVHRLKGSNLVYDSHEYFTGVPELEHRPFVQSIWKTLEKRIFPKLKHVVTVNGSIASLYENEYGIRPAVVRNIPRSVPHIGEITKTSLGISPDTSVIILQGSGINVDRGGEEAVEAMRYLQNVLLIIAGGGDVIPQLKVKVAADPDLETKIRFFPRMPYTKLMQYTKMADIGLSLDKGTNINYLLSLPNKVFDYIHSGTPVLASDLPEVKNIVIGYDVGLCIPDTRPSNIASAISKMLADKQMMEKWQENCKIASESLSWDNEKETLREIYANARKKSDTPGSL